MPHGNELEDQRNLMFGGLDDLRNFYNRPEGQELMNLIMQRARGQTQPFGPNVLQGMLGQNADSAAGAFGANREAIRRQFSNTGMTGSGMEGSAILDAQQRAQGQVRSGRRDIRTRAELENFGAQERGQAQAQSYWADKFASEAQARMKEVDMRSQMHTTESGQRDALSVATQAGGSGQANPARPTRFGLSNTTVLRPRQDPMAWGGMSAPGFVGPGSFAGQGGLATANADYQSQVDQQELDRAHLYQAQADWDARYGG